MLRGNWQGKTLGSGSDAWKYWDERRAGNITDTQWHELESGIARSYGTCMTMGTAATMMSIAEGLGVCFSGSSAIPAPDSNHKRMSACGRRAVEMVLEGLTLDKIISQASVENSVKKLRWHLAVRLTPLSI